MAKRYEFPIPFGWFCVAMSGELAVGQVKPLHYFGRELVLFRTESGEAKVLDAFCPHLGAHLGHGGKVAGESIACPFHGWQFNGGGQCTKVPYAKNMPPKVSDGKDAVGAYPTVERNQMILAWYHPKRLAPTYEVPDLFEFSSDEWQVGECRSWTINTTLQEIQENAADYAHFIYVHGAQQPEGTLTIEGHQRTARYDLQAPAILPDGSLDLTGKMTPGHLESIVSGSGQAIQRFTGAVQATLLGTSTPIDESTTQVRFVFAQPKNISEGQKMLIMGAEMEITRQVEGDIPIWDHKVYLENPMLCDGDGPIHQHRKWFRQFYAEWDAEPTPVRAVG